MRITDFTELTTPTSNDLLVVVDVVNDITKKLKLSSLPISTSVTTALATKQDTLVSGTNIKTLNSVSLLGSGDIVLTANPSGVAGAIQFSNGSAFASDATNFFWDDTNNRLGVGTNAPSTPLHVVGQTTFSDNALFSADFKYIGRELNASSIRFASATSEVRVNISTSGQFAVFNAGSASNRFAVSNGGQTTISGGGSTSATTSLLVQNSAGTGALKVTDDGIVSLNKISSLDGTGIVTMPVYLQSQSGNFVFKNSGSSDLLVLNSTLANFLGTIAFNNSSPSASACVDLTSTTKGFLPPRMTTTQKNAIATPATGLVVYDNTTNKLCCYNGSTWNDLF